MFININSTGFEIETVLFEVFLGNQLIRREQASMPREVLEMRFMHYAQELATRKEPMHLRMSGTVEIWDEFENKMKTLPRSIDYWNYNYEGE